MIKTKASKHDNGFMKLAMKNCGNPDLAAQMVAGITGSSPEDILKKWNKLCLKNDK